MQKEQSQDRQRQKLRQMTTAPVKSLIIKLAIPTMISMMITSIYNMADTFFVGQISGGSEAATSATAGATSTDTAVTASAASAAATTAATTSSRLILSKIQKEVTAT